MFEMDKQSRLRVLKEVRLGMRWLGGMWMQGRHGRTRGWGSGARNGQAVAAEGAEEGGAGQEGKEGLVGCGERMDGQAVADEGAVRGRGKGGAAGKAPLTDRQWQAMFC